MSYQHVYTVDRLPPEGAPGEEAFRVVKHKKSLVLKGLSLSEEGAYKVVKKPSTGFIHCDCYAGLMGKQCRHCEMVLIAEDSNAVNTGRYYDFDRKRWTDSVPASAAVRTIS